MGVEKENPKEGDTLLLRGVNLLKVIKLEKIKEHQLLS
jgi:hypothetical protein